MSNQSFLYLFIQKHQLNPVTVVTIPILLLRKSQMKPSEKLGVGVFLCLSVVMAVIAIIRISGYRIGGRSGSLDVTWVFLWLYLQASIAIIMACLPAFRFLFTSRGSRALDKEKRNGSPWARSQLRKPFRKGSVGWWSGWEEVVQKNLPQTPLATDHDTSRVKTVIYHHKDTSQRETTSPLRSRLDSTWDGGVDPPNDDGDQPGSGKKIDQIYVDHRLEIHSDRCSRDEDSQQRE